jgi:uncharacterized protein YndB with AHSA1/START domain
MPSEQQYNSIVSLDIDVSVDAVWHALTNPDQIKLYMHGADTVTDWVVGQPIVWRGEWQGKPYEDKGVILAFEPQTLLSYTHWSPLGGSEDKPENYHTVTYELRGDATKTNLRLTQSNNPTQAAADSMATNAWGPMMQNFKELLEN